MIARFQNSDPVWALIYFRDPCLRGFPLISINEQKTILYLLMRIANNFVEKINRFWDSYYQILDKCKKNTKKVKIYP
jgi:hypothetical protein